MPTRELALQVHKALATYGAPANVRVTAIFGGVAMGAQIQALRQRHRHRRRHARAAHRSPAAAHGRSVGDQILTLDEADRMLDMGFLPALRACERGAAARAPDAALLRDAARRRGPPLRRVHARGGARGRLRRRGRRGNRDAPCASGRPRAEARAARARPGAARRGRRSSSARPSADRIASASISSAPA